MTQKSTKGWVEAYPLSGPSLVRLRYGAPTPAPLLGNLSVTGSFAQEKLYVYHYVGDSTHETGAIGTATATPNGGRERWVAL